MSAPRSSLRALSKLSRSPTILQSRKLHMTGPATFPSPLLSTETQSRKPSKATASPPENLSSEPNSTTSPFRHFNTSRSLKAPGDSSTIDFMFFPDYDPDANTAPAPIRVPLLPTSGLIGGDNTISYASSEEEPVIMRPEIITASADGTHISAPAAMHEVHDNNTVDFQGMAERVAQGTNMAGEDQEGVGIIKEVLSGMLDDIFGAKKPRIV